MLRPSVERERPVSRNRRIAAHNQRAESGGQGSALNDPQNTSTGSPETRMVDPFLLWATAATPPHWFFSPCLSPSWAIAGNDAEC